MHALLVRSYYFGGEEGGEVTIIFIYHTCMLMRSTQNPNLKYLGGGGGGGGEDPGCVCTLVPMTLNELFVRVPYARIAVDRHTANTVYSGTSDNGPSQ